ILSSGDEILRPGSDFKTGQVYDANHFMLRSLIEVLPVTLTDLGVAEDDSEYVENLLVKAAETHDIILSTGGASRGEEDHFVNVLEKLGSCHMWQLAVKPGRPMSFGQIGDTPCFTLPGNPVAAFVCFLLYVRPALLRLAGCDWKEPETYRVPSGFQIKSKPDRREFLRGRVRHDDQGVPKLEKFARDGSGLITGLRFADGLIEIPEQTTEVQIDDDVNYIPLSQFF
nr:molybdopterin molybdotransferase MoeA [Rhizobiaceae bacterium]